MNQIQSSKRRRQARQKKLVLRSGCSYPSGILFLLLLNAALLRVAVAVCTPLDKNDLEDARDACLDETSDGSCPTFSSASNSVGCGGNGGVNGVIGDWNVGKVTNMYALFQETNAFNGDISNWNVGAPSVWREARNKYLLRR